MKKNKSGDTDNFVRKNRYVLSFIVVAALFGTVVYATAYTLPSQGGSQGTWGTELNNFLGVSLNATGQLNADAVINTTIVSFDASKLTNRLNLNNKITLNGANITAGTVVGARIGSHTHDGANITAGTILSDYIGSHTHSAENITSGTVADARLSDNITKLGATLDNKLTLDGANITSGTVVGARLGSHTHSAENISAGTFSTGNFVFGGNITIRGNATGGNAGITMYNKTDSPFCIELNETNNGFTFTTGAC